MIAGLIRPDNIEFDVATFTYFRLATEADGRLLGHVRMIAAFSDQESIGTALRRGTEMPMIGAASHGWVNLAVCLWQCFTCVSKVAR